MLASEISDMDLNVTYTIGYAATLGEASKVLSREDGRALEVSSPLGLVPPWNGVLVAALGLEDVLEAPEVVSVPEQEDVVAVDLGSESLMERDQVFISALSSLELSRGGLLHQALDTVDESLLVGIAQGLPLRANTGIGANGRSWSGRGSSHQAHEGRVAVGRILELVHGFLEGQRCDKLGCLQESAHWQSRSWRGVRLDLLRKGRNASNHGGSG